MFLDLPKPWYSAAHARQHINRLPLFFTRQLNRMCRLCCGFAKEALKDGGKLVTFSPCIEQIQVKLSPSGRYCNAFPSVFTRVALQRTASQMRSVGFRDVRMFEILSRNMDCAPCEATAAVLDEESSISTPKTTHPIKRLREAAQSSTGAASLSIVSRPPKEEPGHTGYLLFGTLCLPPLEQQ